MVQLQQRALAKHETENTFPADAAIQTRCLWLDGLMQRKPVRHAKTFS